MVLGGLCIHVARSLMLLYRILQSKGLVPIYLDDFFFCGFVSCMCMFFLGEGDVCVICVILIDHS